MTGKKWAFEDFIEGGSIALGSKLVTAEEIVEFAGEFDAQPMHLDEEAGRASILGGLSASGWHTCSMFMRLMCDGFLLDSTSQGSPGLDYVRWKKPVLAGDTLTGKSTVLAKRMSKSKPGLGFITVKSELSNQRGETVLELENTGMFLSRDAVGGA
ncbi:Acyl dehydratase [Mesorhizobium albiziae]|uniref:Acyl dehydratase n=1 Tax=Neomesorhizobium albiziae TaxID=335020 RepID=A0A1I3ZAK6_9HYPH|nr:MaoC family dehydratase [Mesorhizobium albiziae]GLS32111.1 enoyl-CoA hydratase [Mesorhizobium albiziae]SFK41032.1 Acyl dehydratase [Mesorhizobium albiziae]